MFVLRVHAKKKFSDYDENNEQGKILEKSLIKCAEKNIKFIGFLFNDFQRKSFLECQKIYNENYGYYKIIDLTSENIKLYK